MVALQQPPIAQVARVLAQRTDVLFAYLFGSCARDDATTASDLDVALIGERTFGPLELGAIVELLERATGKAVDVVDLRTATPLLGWEVVCDGIVVLDRDSAARLEFELEAQRRELDFRPLRLRQQELLREAARGRTA
jgi:predicted nucleotidyltransferase